MKKIRGIFAAIAFLLAPISAHAQLDSASTWGGTAGGTSNALTVSIHNVVALNDLLGVPIRLIANGVNTTSATLTINLDGGGSLTPTVIKKSGAGALVTLSGCELKTGQESTLIYDGTEFVITSSYGSIKPTFTNLTSPATGTYVTPTCATQLKIRMVGGGGGGGGNGTGSPTSGTSGGNTIFGSFSATLGTGGSFQNGTGSADGGTGGSGGSGAAILRIAGQNGGTVPLVANYPANFQLLGSPGGNSFMGMGGPMGNGKNATGFGGGGSGATSTTPQTFGSSNGGGAGEYAEIIIPNPAATYGYTVGNQGFGGTPGSGGSGGGNGGIGAIFIEEDYY